jgi:hypothetical protein
MTIQKQRHEIAVHVLGCIVATILLAQHLCTSTGYANEIGSQSNISSTQNKDNADITARFQCINDTLNQMEPVVRAIEEEIPSLVGKIKELEDPAIREKHSKQIDEHQSLQEKLEQLRQQVAELKRALESRQNQNPRESRAELEQKIEKATEEKRVLEEKLKKFDSAQVGSDSKGCPEYNKFSTDKPRKYVLIYNGRIAPLEEPYYAFRQGYVQIEGRLIPAAEVKRIKEGEPVSEAIGAGGCLDKLISKLDTDKVYVSFLICTDSIAAFRVAVEHVRKCKISYTWKPEEDRAFILIGDTASGQSAPSVYGEHSK